MEVGEVVAALGGWGLPVRSVAPLSGGLNSTVWSVRAADGRRYVAKLADVESAAGFRSGLRVARRAAQHGFRSGPPVPLPDGSLSLVVPGGELAVLEHVPGRRPDPAVEADLVRTGSVLARAQSTVEGERPCLDRELAWPWPWAETALSGIPMPTGLRDAAGRALEDARRVTERDGLPVQVVHGDPAFDAFVLAPGTVPDRRRDGMIDWAATMGAPALYDLGTVAAVNADHPDRLQAVLRGYLAAAPGRAAELHRLPAFTRLRWMCVALYFADRIARGIVRGADTGANHRGLAEAHHRLTAPDG